MRKTCIRFLHNILVGKKPVTTVQAIVARTEDSQNGVFTPKKFVVVEHKTSHAIISQFDIF